MTACYALMTALVTYAVPPGRITSSAAFVAELGAAIFGDGGARLLAMIVIVSVGGSLAAFLMSAPRVDYAMAGDGVFPVALARTRSKTRHTGPCDPGQSLLAVLILAAGRFETIVAYFVFITVVFLIVAVGGIYRVRDRDHAYAGLLRSGISMDAARLHRTGRRGCRPGGGRESVTVVRRRRCSFDRAARVAPPARQRRADSRRAGHSERGSDSMTWIKIVPFDDNPALARARQLQQDLYPPEYRDPSIPSPGGESIVASHSLIPDAMYHAFAAYGVLLSPDLPLSRRQHEMIATVVSATNRCFY